MGSNPPDLKRTPRQKQAPRTADRLPPHSTESEIGILGCIFLAPNDVIPRCIEAFPEGGSVFYDLKHLIIYNTCVELWDERSAIDVITVYERLKREDQAETIGGLPFLASLPDKVPSAANASYYIDIVKEKYLLRTAIQTGMDVVQKAYEPDGSFEDVAASVESALITLTQRKSVTGLKPMREAVTEATARFESYMQNRGTLTGIATGFADLDRMTSGLQNSDMIVIAARPSMGKAQPLTAQVLTPTGFVPMGTLKAGSFVIGSDGLPTRILGVFPQGKLKVYTITFSDGTQTQCCKDHLWFTQTKNERRRGLNGSVKTTSQIMTTLRRGDGGMRNHAVPLVRPVRFNNENQSLPLHPWLLGALLGDGSLRSKNVLFSKPEADVQEKVKVCLPDGDEATVASDDGMTLRIRRKKRNNEPSETAKAIRSLGLFVFSEQKFIPQQYLLSTPQNRLQLLRGLLDTDGFVLDCGTTVEFSSSSKKLADDVAWLVRSLGGICSIGKTRKPNYSHKGERKVGLTSYRMLIWFPDGTIPVSSNKQLGKWRFNGRKCHKAILKIEPAGEAECQCIAVDSIDQLYVTDDFIVTHNTALALNIADNVAVTNRLPVGIFSLEMSTAQLVERMICSRARVNMRNVREGFLAERDFPRLTAAMSKLASAPIWIDDTPGLSLLQLRTKMRRMQQQYGIRLFVIDYMQLLHANRQRGDSRQQEISEISRGVKGIAKELNVPVIILSQLNREIEKDKKRRPRLSDLRESGAIEQDADLIGFLFKPRSGDEESYVEPDDAIPVTLAIEKQRNGPTGDVELTFLKSFTRFESAARVSNDDYELESRQREFETQPDP